MTSENWVNATASMMHTEQMTKMTLGDYYVCVLFNKQGVQKYEQTVNISSALTCTLAK